jgi:hypothetical protein
VSVRLHVCPSVCLSVYLSACLPAPSPQSTPSVRPFTMLEGVSSRSVGLSVRLAAPPHRANLAAAADSDARLEQRLSANAASFAALSIDVAAAQMPRLQVPVDRRVVDRRPDT